MSKQQKEQIYICIWNGYEENIIDSVWSTKPRAEARLKEMKADTSLFATQFGTEPDIEEWDVSV